MLGTPSWTPQEANFVTSDRLRAIAGLEEVKGCRVAQADLTRVLPAPLRTCSAQSVKENPLVDQHEQGRHWRARTTCARRRQPQRLDQRAVQHDPFGGDPCTMPHSSTTTTTGPTPSSSATPSAWQTLASPSRNPSIAEPTGPGSRRRAQRSTRRVAGARGRRTAGRRRRRGQRQRDRAPQYGRLLVAAHDSDT